MEKDNRMLLKLKVPRMFRTVFGSCKSKDDVSHVTERPIINNNHRQHCQLVELFSPIPHSFPSICRPSEPVQNSCVTIKDLLLPRTKVSDREYSLLASGNMAMEDPKCPPVSSISPLNSFYEFQQFETRILRQKNGRKKAKKKKTARRKAKRFVPLEFNYKGLFSSDEEVDDDDKTTLFSTKSFSSDSSRSFGRDRARFERKEDNERVRWASGSKRKESDDKDLIRRLEGNNMVKDSFAVVKRSSNPYHDFRTSMVEMIIEKQIFGAKDLEMLLQCFLSLNSYHHHRVIIEVFIEIWEALFSKRS